MPPLFWRLHSGDTRFPLSCPPPKDTLLCKMDTAPVAPAWERRVTPHPVPLNARAVGGPFVTVVSQKPEGVRVCSVSSTPTSTPNVAARQTACDPTFAIEQRIEAVRLYALTALDDVSALATSTAAARKLCAENAELVDALVEQVHRQSADKVASLEREATVVDALLERLDAATDGRARDDALAAMADLPRGPVELGVIAFEPVPFPLTAGSNGLGKIIAPPRISAGMVGVAELDGCLLPGQRVEFLLTLSLAYDCGRDTAGAVVGAALSALACHAVVDIELSHALGVQSVAAAVSVCASRRAVIVAFHVPVRAPCGSRVDVAARIAGELVPEMPRRLTVARAMSAPAFHAFPAVDSAGRPVPEWRLGLPTAGLDGTLYMPGNRMGDPIAATSAKGKHLSPLSVPGLAPMLNADCIAVCAETGTLFVQDRIHGRDAHGTYAILDRLVAIDRETGRVLWAKEYNENFSRIAVIPTAIFAVSSSALTLLVLSTTDGTILAESDAAMYPFDLSGQLTVDPSTGLVVAELRYHEDNYSRDISVVTYRWDGVALVCELRAALTALTKDNWYYDHLRTTYAIVPRRPGESRSHLIVSCEVIYDTSMPHGRSSCDIALNVGAENPVIAGDAPQAPQRQVHPAPAPQTKRDDVESEGASHTTFCPWQQHLRYEPQPGTDRPDVGDGWPSLADAFATTRPSAALAAARRVPFRSRAPLRAGCDLGFRVAGPHADGSEAATTIPAGKMAAIDLLAPGDDCGSGCGDTYDRVEDSILSKSDRRLAGIIPLNLTPRGRMLSLPQASAAKSRPVPLSSQAASTSVTATPPSAGSSATDHQHVVPKGPLAKGGITHTKHRTMPSRSKVTRRASTSAPDTAIEQQGIRFSHRGKRIAGESSRSRRRTSWWRPTPGPCDDDDAVDAMDDPRRGGAEDGLADEDVTLNVFTLPDLVLVHRHVLQKVVLRGLSSDLSGSVLIVSDTRCGGVHTLAWQLPGMPRSQY